jgi:hypothetical protein
VDVLAVAAGFALMVALAAAATRPSRRLPEPVCEQIAALPERRRNQHVVDLQLSDGRVIEKVWIAWGKYIALVGGRMRRQRYAARDVVGARLHAAKA